MRGLCVSAWSMSLGRPGEVGEVGLGEGGQLLMASCCCMVWSVGTETVSGGGRLLMASCCCCMVWWGGAEMVSGGGVALGVGGAEVGSKCPAGVVWCSCSCCCSCRLRHSRCCCCMCAHCMSSSCCCLLGLSCCGLCICESASERLAAAAAAAAAAPWSSSAADGDIIKADSRCCSTLLRACGVRITTSQYHCVQAVIELRYLSTIACLW